MQLKTIPVSEALKVSFLGWIPKDGDFVNLINTLEVSFEIDELFDVSLFCQS
jgi:hypothetical protein